MNARVLDSVFKAIDEAIDHSLANFGAKAARDLRRKLFVALDQTAYISGKPVLYLSATCRYLTIKTYNLYYHRDEPADEVLVYLLRSSYRDDPDPAEHSKLILNTHDNAQPLHPEDRNNLPNQSQKHTGVLFSVSYHVA